MRPREFDTVAGVLRGPRGGHTLIEVVISVSIVAVIMGAMVSIMLLVARGTDVSADGTENVSATSEVVQQIAVELSVATNITEQTATAVTFLVPDRDDNLQGETIRYAWSGVAGEPLTRQYNGGSVVTVAEDVHHFNVDYLVKTVGSP